MNIYLISPKRYLMSIDSKSSINDFVDFFVVESSKLQEKISQMGGKLDDLQMEEIIDLYFQVINVTSLTKSLRDNDNQEDNKISEKTLIKIKEIGDYIDEKFNDSLHPLLMSHLEKTIEVFRNNLKNTTNTGSKNKKEIENQAKKFDELRQIMSTKEFLEQYNKVLEERGNL